MGARIGLRERLTLSKFSGEIQINVAIDSHEDLPSNRDRG